MRATALAVLCFACIDVVAAPVRAAEASPPESLLAGTRWMSVGLVARIEDVPLERIVVIRICAIADLAFTMVGDRLTRFDRAGLAGRSQPTGFIRVDVEPGRDGGTLVTLHTATDAADMPYRYRIDASGLLLRAQVGSTDGEAFMKCERGTPPAVPATIFPAIPQGGARP